MRNLLSSSSAVSASMSSKISVISSSAVVNRKLGKPREGEELLEDGDEVRRRSSSRKDDLENCLSASSLLWKKPQDYICYNAFLAIVLTQMEQRENRSQKLLP